MTDHGTSTSVFQSVSIDAFRDPTTQTNHNAYDQEQIHITFASPRWKSAFLRLLGSLHLRYGFPYYNAIIFRLFHIEAN